MTATDLISKLKLLPHPEGGFYRETYRSAGEITTDNGNRRSISTAIYYLLENEQRSLFHRIQSDELWFFHQGETLEIVYIEEQLIKSIFLGNDINAGELPQAIIPANTWFAARVKHARGFTLVSCTVAPGFDFLDFELAERDMLLRDLPAHKTTIKFFTE